MEIKVISLSIVLIILIIVLFLLLVKFSYSRIFMLLTIKRINEKNMKKYLFNNRICFYIDCVKYGEECLYIEMCSSDEKKEIDRLYRVSNEFIDVDHDRNSISHEDIEKIKYYVKRYRSKYRKI